MIEKTKKSPGMAHLKLTHYDEIPVLQLFAIVLISVSSWIQYFLYLANYNNESLPKE